jgi:hypothetical protein
MITYIRHDEEFHGVVKLTTGQEIIGRMVATEEDGKTFIYVENPAEAKVHELKNQQQENKITKGISFSKWFALSDEEFYVIPEETIVSVASMSKEIIGYYVVWVKEQDPNYTSEVTEVEVTEDFGKISSITEAKQKLERIFKYL